MTQRPDYEQDFSRDTDDIRELGWLGEVNADWSVTNRALESSTANSRASVHLGYRPARVELGVILQSNASTRGGVLVRYKDADNYYMVRYSHGDSELQLYEKVAGTATKIDSVAFSITDATAAVVFRVDDDGTDITATILNNGAQVVASNGGASFTNDLLDATRIGVNRGGAVDEFLAVRAWREAPTFAATDPLVPYGATEYWQPPGYRHVGEHDRTYIGWISPYGAVQVQYYDHDDNEWSEIATVAELWGDAQKDSADDHNAPSIVVAEDGTVCVFATIHNTDDSIWVWRSTSPEDITAWDARISLVDGGEAADVYNYVQPYLLPDGTLRIFYRYLTSSSGIWKTKTSDDGGATWGAASTVLDTSGEGFGGYMRTQQDANNPMRLVAAIHVKAVDPTRQGLWYMESPDGGSSWTQTDGTALVLPVATADLERVFDSGEDLFRLTGIAALPTGARILAGYKAEPNHETVVVQYRDGAWEQVSIVDNSLWYDTGGIFYVSGGDCNPTNPDEIVLSVARDGQFEIEKWVTPDSGETWLLYEALTRATAEEQARPMYISRAHPDLSMTWMAGVYKGQDFSGWLGMQNLKIITPLTTDGRLRNAGAESQRLSRLALVHQVDQINADATQQQLQSQVGVINAKILSGPIQAISQYEVASKRLKLIQRDDYEFDSGTHIDIPVNLPSGVDPETATVEFALVSHVEPVTRVELTPDLVEVDDQYYIRFEATSDQMDIPSGQYYWQARAEEAGTLRKTTIHNGSASVSASRFTDSE